jgi:2'-5' RNA ligase
VLGSDLAALDVLDGTTIRPLLDIRGGTPRPPNPAYQQYLWGVPRTDLMDVILQADIEEMAEPVEQYRADQLLYLPYVQRSWTPYGFPPIERAIIPVAAGLKRDQYVLDWFTEGSIPGLFVIPGPDVATPQQVRELQETLNALAGDAAWKHRIIVLPAQSKTEPQKPVELADAWDEVNAVKVCQAYDVMPMELGIIPARSTSGPSAGAANQMAKLSREAHERKATKPLLQWLKTTLFDRILQQVCGQPDMEWVWKGLEQGEDELGQTQVHRERVGGGLESIDEARIELGKDPWGLPMTSGPIIITAAGAVPVQPAEVEETEEDDGSPGSGGGGKTPLHEGEEAAHQQGQGAAEQRPATKAAGLPPETANELRQLRVYLRKGRPISQFRTDALSTEVLAAARPDADAGRVDQAIGKARQAAHQEARRAVREAVLSPLRARVRGRLSGLVGSLRASQHPAPTFVDETVRMLRQVYLEAGHAGAGVALVDRARGLTKAEQDSRRVERDAELAAMADRRAEAQRGYLQGLAQDVLAGVEVDDARLGLWADTVQPAYEEGYGAEMAADETGYQIWWEALSDACELCLEHQGNSPYTEETLPGWPGDGGFGALCYGGQRCRCSLAYTERAQVLEVGRNTAREDALTDQLAVAQRQADRDAAAIAAREQEIARVAEASPGAAQRMRARDELMGVPGTSARMRFDAGQPLVAASATAQVTKAAQRGVMVALYPTVSAAQVLALDPDRVQGAEPVERLHLTLLYVAEDLDLLDDLDALRQAVRSFASTAPVLEGRIGGHGRFHGEEEDAVVALPDLPELPRFRQALVNRVESALAGNSRPYEPAERHGFTPHITLAYVGPNEPTPQGVPGPLPLRFEQVSLAVGGRREDFDLQGGEAQQR